MRTVKIANIIARAKRLNQPEMIERYRDDAVTWDDVAGVCTLEDDDHREINLFWRETPDGQPQPAPKPCSGCRGH